MVATEEKQTHKNNFVHKENPFQEALRQAEERRRRRRRRRNVSRNIECGPEGYQRLAESTDDNEDEEDEEEEEEQSENKADGEIGMMRCLYYKH